MVNTKMPTPDERAPVLAPLCASLPGPLWCSLSSAMGRWGPAVLPTPVPLPKPPPAPAGPESSEEGADRGEEHCVTGPAPLQKPKRHLTKHLLAVPAGHVVINGFVPVPRRPCLAQLGSGGCQAVTGLLQALQAAHEHCCPADVEGAEDCSCKCTSWKRAAEHRHSSAQLGMAWHSMTNNAQSLGPRPLRTRCCRKPFINLACDPQGI